MTSVTGSAESAFRRHYGDVYRYLRRRTRDHHEAEELTQRVFADAAASLDGAETPLAWLYTVARRRFADQARRAGRTVELGELPAVELVHGPATARAIRAALALTFLAPWSSGAHTLVRALAALGQRPVVHVVARVQEPGAVIRTESWYDTRRRLMHTKIRRNGKLVDDFVVRTFMPVRPPRIAGFVAPARGGRVWIAPP